MKFLEVTINTKSQAIDLISSLIWEYTDLGVTICDDKDIIDLMTERKNSYDYIDDSLVNNMDLNSSKLKCYFNLNEESKINSLYLSLLELKNNAREIDFGTLEFTNRVIEGDDWIDVWKKHYKPIKFDKIIICPEWIKCEDDKLPVLKINGNLAFGTGEHETTSMCINHLGKMVSSGNIVIDVGTGSGILGIASAMFGAKKVIMTDIDPVAVDVAKYNVKLNNVEDICEVYQDNLLDKNSLVGDIIVANLTAEILYILAKSINSYCRKGSYIILSGILKDRLNKVIDCYKKIGFNEVESLTEGEWSSLIMVKE